MRIKKVKLHKRNQNVFYKLCTKMNDLWDIFMSIFYLTKYLFLWNLFKNLLKESLLFYYTLKTDESYWKKLFLFIFFERQLGSNRKRLMVLQDVETIQLYYVPSKCLILIAQSLLKHFFDSVSRNLESFDRKYFVRDW